MVGTKLEKSVPVFHVFGIEVRAHWSWFLLALLVASSLATGWFPALAPGLDSAAYWSAALVCSIGLFLSIVFHELSHAVVGRLLQMPVDKITMFLFGGVAHLQEDPQTPKQDFLTALAGPVMSLFLTAGFYWAYVSTLASPPLVNATFSYLASINLVVAAFNLLPGFPLDGGRLLRATLWHFKKDIMWATRVASSVGQFCGLLLLAVGVAQMFRGQGFSGIWSMLLGFLLMGFARSAYVQLVMKRELHGRPAANSMDPSPQTVQLDMAVSDLMRDFSAHPEATLLPVVENDRFLGCVASDSARRIPKDEWAKHQVREIFEKCELDHVIAPETDAESALLRMLQTGYRELLVVKGGRLVGLLTQAALKI